MGAKPTEEEQEIVRKKMEDLGPDDIVGIHYLPWESRRTVPLYRPSEDDPLDESEWEWDSEKGIGFNSSCICKFVGEFPKGKEFDNDSLLFKVSKVNKNGIVL
jgi:hypothetical protein